MDKHLILNLKIISQIPKNGRICGREKEVISIDNPLLFFMQPFTRFWYRNSRQQSINDISYIVESCIERIKELESLINSSECYNKIYEKIYALSKELNNSICGIENLKTTYSNDITTIAKLDLIITDVERFTNYTYKKYKIDHSLSNISLTKEA